MPDWRSGFGRCLVMLGVGLIQLAACSGDSGAVATGAATRTLLPPTATPTPAPVVLTPAATDLPAPSALSLPTHTSVPQVSSVVQALIDRTARDLVERDGVAPESVRLLSVDAVTWSDGSWGCKSRGEGSPTALPVTQGYRIVFTAGSRVYVYHTDDQDTFFMCQDRVWLALEGKPVIVDPIAQSMVDLTRHDAAQRLKAPDAEITLASLLTILWPDSSLGCPRAGADYEDREMSGYRIVFRMADETFVYHTSIRDFVRCAPEEEILPGILRQTMPTPEPSPTP